MKPHQEDRGTKFAYTYPTPEEVRQIINSNRPWHMIIGTDNDWQCVYQVRPHGRKRSIRRRTYEQRNGRWVWVDVFYPASQRSLLGIVAELQSVDSPLQFSGYSNP